MKGTIIQTLGHKYHLSADQRLLLCHGLVQSQATTCWATITLQYLSVYPSKTDKVKLVKQML